MFSKSAKVWRRAALAWVLAVLGFCPAAFASSSAYVANDGSNTVSQYTVAANGTLSPKTPATVATGSGPDAVALSADGKSAYVTNSGSNTVSQYTVAANGTLSPKTPATVATGSGPFAVALSADGKSAYVTNYNSNTVSQFTVAANGTLSPKTPATVATGIRPVRGRVERRREQRLRHEQRRQHGFAVHGRGERDAVAQDPGDASRPAPARAGSR